jgi:hypothetical protein
MCVVVSDRALQAVFVGKQFLAPVAGFARKVITHPIFNFVLSGNNSSKGAVL